LGLFWTLLHVPESNAWMLALSGGIVVALGALACGLYTSTVLWLRGTTTPNGAFRAGFTRWAPAIVGAALGGLLWWTGRAAADAVAAHAGEIDAWIIAQFQRTQTAGVHRVLAVFIGILQYVVAPAVGVTALCVALFEGLFALRSWAWLGRALSVRALAQTAAAVFAFIWAPWQLAYWRPEAIPPNAAELVFAAVKLGTIFVVANFGVVVLLLGGLRAAQSSVDERDHL
jgi:hypothetical protein